MAACRHACTNASINGYDGYAKVTHATKSSPTPRSSLMNFYSPASCLPIPSTQSAIPWAHPSPHHITIPTSTARISLTWSIACHRVHGQRRVGFVGSPGRTAHSLTSGIWHIFCNRTRHWSGAKKPLGVANISHKGVGHFSQHPVALLRSEKVFVPCVLS